MALEDQWTKQARRRIAEYRLFLEAEPIWTLQAAFCRGQVEWLESEIAAHLDRNAADASNIVILDNFRAD